MQEMVTLTLVVRKEEDCWLGECVIWELAQERQEIHDPATLCNSSAAA